MKNLCLDVGNTHIAVGYLENKQLLHTFRIATNKFYTEDEYFLKLNYLLESFGKKMSEIQGLALSSVVPSLSKVFVDLQAKYAAQAKLVQVSSKTSLGLNFGGVDPSAIGADLLVNAYAAKQKYGRNCIVLDFGTATTIQLVSAQGDFVGGSIVPGVITSAKTLFSSAAELSQVVLQPSRNLVSLDTTQALQAGIVNGTQFLVSGFVRQIKKESDLDNIYTVATGGLAKLICQDLPEIDCVDSFLILEGLDRLLYSQV